MKLLQIFRLRKFIFVNILLFSYVMLNLLDGERGLISYIEKLNIKEQLLIEKQTFKCEYCHKKLATKFSLERHLGQCQRKELIEMMNGISDNMLDKTDIVSNILSSNIA